MKEGAVLQRVDMKNKLVLHLIPQADENLHQLTERLHAFLRTWLSSNLRNSANAFIVRMSEEANREATRTSNIALYIAIAALNCRCVSNHRFDLAAWQV